MQTSIPIITGASLTGMPEVIRSQLGPLAERRAFGSAGLTPEVVATENAFIPESALVTFIDSTARQAGMPNLGLAIAQHLSFTRYGTWGRYLMEAETLGTSLARCRAAIQMHASYSTFRVEQEAGLVWVRYRFPTSTQDGYANLAFCGAGILIDYARQYAEPDWLPEVIEFDIPRPPRIVDIEDAFPCRLRFSARCLGIGIDPALLGTRPRNPLPEQRTTLADVARARLFRPPSDLEGVVRELVRVQIRSKAVSLDAAARAIGYGTRRLQRALDREGLSFREITRSTRVQTAKELITQTSLPISKIGSELGYSAKGHFSRAFRRDVGLTPSEYRDRFGDPIAQPNALGSSLPLRTRSR